MPKLGDVLYVRSVEEPVTFIKEREVIPSDNFPDGVQDHVYIVRRAQMSPENGVVVGYRFFDFLASELETAQEQSQRIFSRMKERQELAMSGLESDGGPLGNLVPSKITKH